MLIENKPSKVITMIPDLPNGNYQEKVVTQFMANGQVLENAKSIYLSEEFGGVKSLRMGKHSTRMWIDTPPVCG